MKLSEYVRRRNGLPLGARGSFRNMLKRSFGADTFTGFWRYWNPIFGYAFSRYVYSPLRNFLPISIALILTFIACGLLHDAVTMLIGWHIAFLFTPWFFLLGLGVTLGSTSGVSFRGKSLFVRVSANLVYLSICLVGALLIRAMVGL